MGVGMDWPQTIAINTDEALNTLDRWLPLFSIVFIVLLVYVMFRMLAVMPKTKPQEIKASKRSGVRWDDIAGVEGTKDELPRGRRVPLRPEALQERSAPGSRRGSSCTARPGTGKTMLAKAVAHESGANFFSQSASSFVEMFAGLGAARIRRLFKEARDNAPVDPLHRRARRRRRRPAAATSPASATRR